MRRLVAFFFRPFFFDAFFRRFATLCTLFLSLTIVELNVRTAAAETVTRPLAFLLRFFRGISTSLWNDHVPDKDLGVSGWSGERAVHQIDFNVSVCGHSTKNG